MTGAGAPDNLPPSGVIFFLNKMATTSGTSHGDELIINGGMSNHKS